MYKTIQGDTFELIARKMLGTELHSKLVQQANPGLIEPMPPGLSITIPSVPGAPTDKPQDIPGEENEVALSVDGSRFRFWHSIKLTLSIDAMDMVEFSTPLTLTDEFKKIFRPFSYKKIEVALGGSPLFTGTMIGVEPAVTPVSKTLLINGYSLPGVLNDCTLPASAYPQNEFIKMNLQGIADSLTKIFGLSAKFDTSSGPIFEIVSIGPTQKILSFLSKLARQRNFIITSTPAGELHFLRSVEPGNPVGELKQGQPPVLSVTPTFDPQGYYSHITGLSPALAGLGGSQFTVKNPNVEVLRPLTFAIDDIDDAAAKAAVDSKMGRMFGQAASYSVRVATWRDPVGNLWKPNTTIELQAEDAMIYESYEFLIRSVTFERTPNSETAILSIVLPGAFSGKIPEVLPWD